MNNVRFNRRRCGTGGYEEGMDTGQTGISERQHLEDYRRKIRFKQVKFAIVVVFWQMFIIVLGMLLLDYSPELVPMEGRRGMELEHMARITTFLIIFVSIFCGWPCLLHFMAGFARTGVVLSSVTGCLVFQSALIIRASISMGITGQKHQINLHDLTESVLVTASFHISCLSLLGRMPPLHLLLTAVFFLPGQAAARTLQMNLFFTLDPGASASIHLYGSVFGTVAAALLFHKVNKKKYKHENYVPSSVSLTGSFLIAMSFLIVNGLGVQFAEMERSMLNTVLMQSATTTAAAAALVGYSSIKQVPLMFEILQGSLLAGGIACGPLAATQFQPWGAMLLGIVIGVSVVASGLFLEPLINTCLDIPPAYTSLSVHGLPAFIGGLVGILLAGISEEKSGLLNYSISLYTLYPARTPPAGWSCYHGKPRHELDHCPSSGDEVRSFISPDLPEDHRTALEQAGWQAISLGTTIIIALISGLLAGISIKKIGQRGSSMPVSAWYDGTCFLDTPNIRTDYAAASLRNGVEHRRQWSGLERDCLEAQEVAGS